MSLYVLEAQSLNQEGGIMVIPIQLTVLVHNEYIDQGPTHARVQLDDKLIEWLRKMERVVKRNKIEYIADNNCAPIYFYLDEGEDPPVLIKPGCNVECEMVVVKKGGFYWKGIIKHSDPAVHYETDLMSFNHLKDMIEFYNLPLSEMPKYINDDDYTKREISLQRMKGEHEV
jgi:hypothetical protein